MGARAAIWIFVLLMLGASWAAACVLFRAAGMTDRVAPLAERDFSELTLVAVGTGGAYENPARGGPATAVALGSRVVLVDAGRGVAEGLRRAKIPVQQPEAVFLTNLLPENTLGLDDLLLTGWLAPREQPLRLIGPPGTKELAAGLERAHAAGVDADEAALGLPAGGAAFEVLEVGDGWSEERDGLRISAGALPGGPTPALAWRFQAGDQSAVISGTGWAPDALVDFAAGANVLVHEAVFVPTPEDAEAAGVQEDPERLRREAALHTSILDVGSLARRAGVGTLVLVRMRPPPLFDLQVSGLVGQTFDGRIVVPEDGDEITP
jgi:ribonuclease BN (tRNA processing enzyme)